VQAITQLANNGESQQLSSDSRLIEKFVCTRYIIATRRERYECTRFSRSFRSSQRQEFVTGFLFPAVALLSVV